MFFYVQIKEDQEEKFVCKKAFCSLHGVPKHRVERIAASSSRNITSPTDGRGMHQNRPNRLPENIVAQIEEHIRSFPKRRSHYGRKDNSRKYYLAAHLNISKMHLLYLEKYEPDMYLLKIDGHTIHPVVKYDFYANYFNHNFKMSFGRPRVDTCQTCDDYVNKIAASTDDLERRSLMTLKELHVRKAETFYDELRQTTLLAKNDESVEVLTFDFEQNFPLPHVPAGDVFYKRQIWEFNFCITSASTGRASMYMYDEMTGKKGPSEVLSFFNHYIQNRLSPNVRTLHLFSDNCGAQNKNHTMVCYLLTLIKSSALNQVKHHFPLPGHSFLPCDRCFGLIEKERRRHDRIHLPSEWEALVKKTSRKFDVVSVTRDMIFNYPDYYRPYFKKNSVNQNKEKFSISKYRLLQYDKTHSRVVRCSVNASGSVYSDFSLQKVSAIPASALLVKLYVTPLKIKSNKVKDVLTLVSKYVPLADKWYYDQIVSDEPDETINNDTDSGSDVESESNA